MEKLLESTSEEDWVPLRNVAGGWGPGLGRGGWTQVDMCVSCCVSEGVGWMNTLFSTGNWGAVFGNCYEVVLKAVHVWMRSFSYRCFPILRVSPPAHPPACLPACRCGSHDHIPVLIHFPSYLLPCLQLPYLVT